MKRLNLISITASACHVSKFQLLLFEDVLRDTNPQNPEIFCWKKSDGIMSS